MNGPIIAVCVPMDTAANRARWSEVDVEWPFPPGMPYAHCVSRDCEDCGHGAWLPRATAAILAEAHAGGHAALVLCMMCAAIRQRALIDAGGNPQSVVLSDERWGEHAGHEDA